MSLPLNYSALQLFLSLTDTARENYTPFTSKLSEWLRSWANQEGITINVQNLENIEYISTNKSQNNIVNLFLPSHRSPIPDAMLVGHLNLPHYILFANLGSFLADHQLLAQQVSLLPEVIGIGKVKDADPCQKLIRALKNKLSPNVINYPQGFVPSAGEIMPISSMFVEKLLVPLINEGFNVKIIPVTYEVDSEFLFDKPNHRNCVYTIKYGKVLTFEAINTLVKFPKYIDHYLLSHWYEQIIEFKELSLEEMIERVEKCFGFEF
jgi:hypothetical protein